MAEFLDIATDEVDRLRVRLMEEYGTTAAGAEVEFGLSQRELYAGSVEQVDASRYIGPDPQLDAMLATMPAQLHIFTNATRSYTQGVLKALGVERHFEQIFDVEFCGWCPKPAAEAYARVLAELDIAPEQVGFIEDNPGNIVPAHHLGMTTFLLRQEHEAADYTLANIHELHPLLLKQSLYFPRPE
jgi:putative hydrolase of the HAD superfamily